MIRLRDMGTMEKVDMVVSALAVILCVLVCTLHPPVQFTVGLVIVQSVYLAFQVRRVIRRMKNRRAAD